MRTLIVTLALALQIAFPRCASSQNDHDHLALLNTKLFTHYRKILTSRLGLTPSDYGRVIVSPAFEPEYSISIYQSTGLGHGTYRITYVAATESIWALTNGGNDLSRIEEVNIRRTDADIPMSTAGILKQVWMKMLKQSRGHAPPDGEWGRIPMDSTSIEWYLQLPDRRLKSAEVNNYFPIGPNTRAFIGLTTGDLVQYCKADPKVRPAIARKIEASARKLLAATSAR
jgi:hypothetical protein